MQNSTIPIINYGRISVTLLQTFIHKLIDNNKMTKRKKFGIEKNCSLIGIEIQKCCYRRPFITVIPSELR